MPGRFIGQMTPDRTDQHAYCRSNHGGVDQYGNCTECGKPWRTRHDRQPIQSVVLIPIDATDDLSYRYGQWWDPDHGGHLEGRHL